MGDDLAPLLAAGEFNSIAWLNGLLTVPPSTGSSDTLLSSLLVRLQLLGSETSDRVEANMTRIVTALPRVKRDARLLGAELPALAAVLEAGVAAQAAALPAAGDAPGEGGGAGAPGADAPHYLAQLAQLDAAQGRLEAVAQQLSTAVAWDRLVRETEGVFEAAVGSAKLPRMTEHIAALERTAAALLHMPEAEQRAAFLAAANAELDRTLAPLLARALADQAQLGGMRALVAAFERLERPERLAEAAAALRVAPLGVAWAAFARLVRSVRDGGAGEGGAAAAAAGEAAAALAAAGAGAAPAATAVASELLRALPASSAACTPEAVARWLGAWYAGIARVCAADAQQVLAYYTVDEEDAGSPMPSATPTAAQPSAPLLPPHTARLRAQGFLTRMALAALAPATQGSGAGGSAASELEAGASGAGGEQLPLPSTLSPLLRLPITHSTTWPAEMRIALSIASQRGVRPLHACAASAASALKTLCALLVSTGAGAAEPAAAAAATAASEAQSGSSGGGGAGESCSALLGAFGGPLVAVWAQIPSLEREAYTNLVSSSAAARSGVLPQALPPPPIPASSTTAILLPTGPAAAGELQQLQQQQQPSTPLLLPSPLPPQVIIDLRPSLLLSALGTPGFPSPSALLAETASTSNMAPAQRLSTHTDATAPGLASAPSSSAQASVCTAAAAALFDAGEAVGAFWSASLAATAACSQGTLTPPLLECAGEAVNDVLGRCYSDLLSLGEGGCMGLLIKSASAGVGMQMKSATAGAGGLSRAAVGAAQEGQGAVGTAGAAADKAAGAAAAAAAASSGSSAAEGALRQRDSYLAIQKIFCLAVDALLTTHALASVATWCLSSKAAVLLTLGDAAGGGSGNGAEVGAVGLQRPPPPPLQAAASPTAPDLIAWVSLKSALESGAGSSARRKCDALAALAALCMAQGSAPLLERIPALVTARRGALALAACASRIALECLLAPVVDALRGYHAFGGWCGGGGGQQHGSSPSSASPPPSSTSAAGFSIQPTPAIQRVCDALLGAVRAAAPSANHNLLNASSFAMAAITQASAPRHTSATVAAVAGGEESGGGAAGDCACPPLRATVAAHALCALASSTGLGENELRAAYAMAGCPFPALPPTGAPSGSSSSSSSAAPNATSSPSALLAHQAMQWSSTDMDNWATRVLTGGVRASEAVGESERGEALHRDAGDVVTASATALLCGAAKATAGLLVLELLRVPRWDAAGAAQARADCTYLTDNVLSALWGSGGGGGSAAALLARVSYLLVAPVHPVMTGLCAASGVAVAGGVLAAAAGVGGAAARGAAGGGEEGALPICDHVGEAGLRRSIARARGLLPVGGER